MKIFRTLVCLIFIPVCVLTSSCKKSHHKPALPSGTVTMFVSGIIDGADVMTYPYGIVSDASGNFYVADFGTSVIHRITSDAYISTYAGSINTGAINATGTTASFKSPAGLAIDASGNIYVADKGNHLIRKIAPGAIVTTLAGSGSIGSVNDTGTVASFNSPSGVAVDASGNVYVADTDNNLIRKITPAGVVTTLAGSGSIGSVNDTGTVASFNGPSGIAVDASGNVYVVDTDNNMIRKVTAKGVVTTVAGSGNHAFANGTGTAASFNKPIGILLDGSGNIYIADSGNNVIRKIDAGGVVTTFSGAGIQGSANGPGEYAYFYYPSAMTFDLAGNMFVSDTDNNMIREIYK
jgi:sugar lactone lactonase YvrE